MAHEMRFRECMPGFSAEMFHTPSASGAPPALGAWACICTLL